MRLEGVLMSASLGVDDDRHFAQGRGTFSKVGSFVSWRPDTDRGPCVG